MGGIRARTLFPFPLFIVSFNLHVFLKTKIDIFQIRGIRSKIGKNECLLCCVDFLFHLVETLVRFFNKYAYVQVLSFTSFFFPIKETSGIIYLV